MCPDDGDRDKMSRMCPDDGDRDKKKGKKL